MFYDECFMSILEDSLEIDLKMKKKKIFLSTKS